MQSKTALFFLLFLISFYSVSAQDDLDKYVNRLKLSQASGGKETAFLTAGSDFMYGQEYFEARRYDMAAMYFKRAQNAEPENPFFNYQLAIALVKQNDQYKAQEAAPFLEKAFALNPGLKQRFAQDMPQAAKANTLKEVVTPVNGQPQNQPQNGAPGGLNAYLEELKYSRATSGPKTAMFTAGQEVMYGYDYYEKGEYDMAESRFSSAVGIDGEDIYANYLLGVSLAAQGKNATRFLDKAFAGDPQLKAQYTKDVVKAKAIQQQKDAAKKPIIKTPVKEKAGGKLFIGSYVCRQPVWNGPGANPQYSYPDRGTIHLRGDGTYRWLDNGPVGRYSYDPKTGAIKWLSGHLAGYTIKSSVFQPGDKVASISINFSDTLRWGCGCTK